MGTKLLIAMPNYSGVVDGLAMDSVMRLMRRLNELFARGEIVVMRVDQLYIDITRNALWAMARNLEAENILWIDDDMVVNEQAFDLMWESGKNIVSALYFVRKEPPTYPCMYDRKPSGKYASKRIYPKDTLIEVDGSGIGFCLMRKPVIQAMNDAPFSTPNGGEDFYFLEQAQKQGFKVWVHTGAKVGHVLVKRMIITEENSGNQDMPRQPIATEPEQPEAMLQPGRGAALSGEQLRSVAV